MEETIINFVEKNEFIYNKRHKDYRNRCLRNGKFHELAEQLNMPKDKIKKRWRTLRDTFLKEMKYEIKNPRCGEIGEKKKWKWLDSMMFLHNERDNDIWPKPFTKVIHKEQKEHKWFNENFDYNIKIEPNNDSELKAGGITYDLDENSINKTTCSFVGSTISKSDSFWNSSTSNQTNDLFFMANSPFIVPEQEEKTYMRVFFDSITQQVQEACISPQDFGKMQIEILKVVNEILYKN